MPAARDYRSEGSKPSRTRARGISKRGSVAKLALLLSVLTFFGQAPSVAEAIARRALRRTGSTITLENGKTFAEGKAELRRAIENVEVACGIPMMMQGYNLEDVARGIDETMIRQPLGCKRRRRA